MGPRAVAEEVDAVFVDGFLDFGDMSAQVGDACVVLHHAVFIHLVEEVVVELEAGLVRLLLIAVREDARPRDARAEALESHLGEQGDVFLIMMIEVDRLVVWVVLPGQHAVRDLSRHAVAPGRHDIGDRDTPCRPPASRLRAGGRRRRRPIRILLEIPSLSPLHAILEKICGKSFLSIAHVSCAKHEDAQGIFLRCVEINTVISVRKFIAYMNGGR